MASYMMLLNILRLPFSPLTPLLVPSGRAERDINLVYVYKKVKFLSFFGDGLMFRTLIRPEAIILCNT